MTQKDSHKHRYVSLTLLGVFNNLIIKSQAIKLTQPEDNTIYEKRDFGLNQVYSFAQTNTSYLEDYLYSETVSNVPQEVNTDFEIYYDHYYDDDERVMLCQQQSAEYYYDRDQYFDEANCCGSCNNNHYVR